MSTEKQRQYIASLMNQNYGEYQTLDTIFDSIPKNDLEHPDERCDYRQIILTEKLSPLSQAQAKMIIAWFLGQTDRFGHKIRTKVIFQILTKLNLVN